MADAQSFPLLRLPSLAHEHVIMVMDVREQYLFSALSRKSNRLAKNGIRLISYIFRFRIYQSHIFIDIKKDWSSHWFSIIVLPNGSEDRISDPIDEIQLNVEDIGETSIKLLKLLNEQFKASRISLIFGQISNNFTKRFLDFVRNLKISIYKLQVCGEQWGPENEMHAWVMDNCHDVKRLTSICGATRDFEWNSQMPFAPEYCYLWFAHWLAFDHLTRIFINCRFFQSRCSSAQITETELNQFVKIWIEDSKLEFIKIMPPTQYSIQHVLRDIQKEPVQEAFIENRLRRFKAGEAFKIQQKSGNEAVVSILKDFAYAAYVFTLTTHFNDRKCDFWDVKEEEEKVQLEEDEGEEEEDFEDEDLQDEDEKDEDEEEENFEDEENEEDEDFEDEEDEEEEEEDGDD